ncbi:MAG: Gfo/Idh/MocA family protein [Rhizobiaceae bacterium]
MPGRRARIAMMGAGLIGRRHAEHIAREAALAAIVDPGPGAADVAREHGVELHPDLDSLLRADRPDGILIATPNQLHVEHGLACINEGLPTLIEKPIAADSSSGEVLAAAAEARGVPLLVGHHRRHNPAIRMARQMIDAGRLGTIVAAHVTCWFRKPDDYFDVDWRRNPGAGPIYINLIHDIDLMRFLCGPVRTVTAVQSDASRGNDVEDTAAVLLVFENGAIGTVTLSDAVAAPWSWELTAGENPAYPRTGENSMLIGGTHGSLSIPDLSLWHYSGRRSWWEPILREQLPVASEDPLALQIRHFGDVILNGAKPLVGAQEGLESLRVVEAVKQAADSGKTVVLSE